MSLLETLLKFGPRAGQVFFILIDAVREAAQFRADLKRHRVDKSKALGIVEKQLEALGLFSGTVENQREGILQWASQGIDWIVGGINLTGGLGERIEFDPEPIPAPIPEPIPAPVATDKGGKK